jgi:hypothetical protein
MLAIRYGLMYPAGTDRLVLVDPIGLEDWKAKGVPWQSVDAWYQQERETSADRIREYEQSTYYGGIWQPAYETWVQMLAGLATGLGHAPQIQAPEAFHAALPDWLTVDPTAKMDVPKP